MWHKNSLRILSTVVGITFTSCGSKTNTIFHEIYLLIFKFSDLSNFQGGNSPANGFQFIFSAIWESNLERAEIKSFQWTCRTCEKNVGDFVGAHSRVINSRRDKFVRIFWGCSDRGWGRPRGQKLGGRGLSTWKRCWGQRRQVTVGKKEYRWQWIATIKYFCLVWQAFKLSI